MCFEDAHWIDPTSRELLDLTVEQVRELPVLLIVTFRPEFQPPWTGQPQVTMLALNRLDRHDRTVLVEQIAGGKTLPEEVVAQIVDRTDGVPLFVEELTKSVLESGVPLVWDPVTLHDSLMARLDRLASVRRVAQIGCSDWTRVPLRSAACRLPSSRGRAASRSRSPRRLRAGVPAWHAARRGLQLQARAGAGRGARQPAAQIPAAIARADRRSARNPFPRADGQPARDLRAALCGGRARRKIRRLLGQGRPKIRCPLGDGGSSRAIAKGARPAGAVAGQPRTSATGARILQCPGRSPCTPVKGHAAPKRVQAYARARELWEQLGSPRSFFRFPLAARYHMGRGELDLAQRLDEDLLRLSRERNDSAGLVLGTCSGRT